MAEASNVNTRVDTGGGAYVDGNIDTGSGPFIGRDEIVHGDKVARNKTQIRIGDVGPGANVEIHVKEQEQQIEILTPPFMAPNEVVDFVGRQELIEKLTRLLSVETDRSVIGIVGIGGVGKTSLATHMAYTLKNKFPDGVLWADFNDSTPEHIIESFALEFGQKEEVGKRTNRSSKAKFVRNILIQKHLLVILDNVGSSEQIECIRDLIPLGAKARTLIATRDRKIFPEFKVHIVDVPPWNLTESIDYLRSTVGSARIDTQADEAEKIIKYVGGLPLALFIVAGRLNEQNKITLAEYNKRLEKIETRLKPLKEWTGKRRNVYVTFEESYSILPPQTQQVFASLSVFDGPDFDGSVVAAINPLDEAEVSDGLGQLYSLSFVNQGLGERNSLVGIEPEDEGRYRLHALLKAFALTKLGDSADNVRGQLASYYVDLAQRYSKPASYPVFDLEWQNVVMSLEWAYNHQEWTTLIQGVLALTCDQLGQMGFLDVRGYWSEARRILAWAYEGLNNIDNPLQKSRILTNLGGFAVRQTAYEKARTYLKSALELLAQQPESLDVVLQKAPIYDLTARSFLPATPKAAQQQLECGIEELSAYQIKDNSIELIHYIGYLHIQLSSILGWQGRFNQVITTAEKGLKLLDTAPSSAKVSGLLNLGNAYKCLTRLDASNRYYHEGVKLALVIGDMRRLAALWLGLAENEGESGNTAIAVDYFERALKIYQRMGDVYHESGLRLNIGSYYLRLGDESQAKEHLEYSLKSAELHKFTNIEARVLSNLADLLIRNNEISSADSMLAQAHHIATESEINDLVPTIVRQQAEVALLRHEFEFSLNLLEQSLRMAQENEEVEEESIGLRVKGSALYALHKPEQAMEVWQESLRLLKGGDPYELARTKLTIAEKILRTAAISLYITQAKTWLDEAAYAFIALDARREIQQAQELLTL